MACTYYLKIIILLTWTAVSSVAFVKGVFGIYEVSVMEGDSVTLNTSLHINQHRKTKWYFNDTRIAEINRDQSKTCTDVQCNEGTERFTGRLKLDHQTGSLTIMNTSRLDCGVYRLDLFISSSDINEKIFNISVCGASAVSKRKRRSVKEGESVTLDTCVTKNPADVMKWYVDETLITEITGDQSKICTDDERFRDRLKLDHQTGSLTIMNTRITDEGEYKLQINSNSSSINRIVAVLTVIAVPGSGLSSGAVAGICIVVFLLLMAMTVAVCCSKGKETRRNIWRLCHQDQENGEVQHPSPDQKNTPLMTANNNDDDFRNVSRAKETNGENSQ